MALKINPRQPLVNLFVNAGGLGRAPTAVANSIAIQRLFTYFSDSVKRQGTTLQVKVGKASLRGAKEINMNIVYAAEKPSIAKVLSEHVKRQISPGDIDIQANPDETGSFFIRWQFDRFILSPSGEVADNVLALIEHE